MSNADVPVDDCCLLDCQAQAPALFFVGQLEGAAQQVHHHSF